MYSGVLLSVFILLAYTSTMNELKDPYLFWPLLIASNFAMYAFTFIIARVWSSVYKQTDLPITSSDVTTSIKVLFVNILVALPGYLLFTHDLIQFSDGNFVLHLLLLFFGFDLCMYALHWVSHQFWPFKALHQHHHNHRHFNALSLYVMHPTEAFSFGSLLTISAYLYPLNFNSFMAFLIINWLYGVVAHLNSSSTQSHWFFGDHIFHKNHHQRATFNYGFYTTLWDRLFSTFWKK